MRGLHRGNRVPEGTAIGNAAMAFLFFSLTGRMRPETRFKAFWATFERHGMFAPENALRRRTGEIRAPAGIVRDESASRVRDTARISRARTVPTRVDASRAHRIAPQNAKKPDRWNYAGRAANGLKTRNTAFWRISSELSSKKKKHRGVSHGACIMVLHPSQGYGRFE